MNALSPAALSARMHHMGPVERMGRLVAVTGAHAIILLDADEQPNQQSRSKSPEIGTLLKVDTPPSIALARRSLRNRRRRALSGLVATSAPAGVSVAEGKDNTERGRRVGRRRVCGGMASGALKPF